jgi:LysM domain
MRATTLSYMGPNFEVDTGDFLGTLTGLFGGGGNAPNPAGGGGPGKTLGSLGGASIAAALGMPQFAPMASSAGSLLGGLAQQGIESFTKPKPKAKKPRQLSRNEQRILEHGRAKARQTGHEAHANEAALRVYRPAEYKRLKALGKLPSQSPPVKPVEQPASPKPAPAQAKPLPPVMMQPLPAPAPTTPAAPPAPTRPTLNLTPLFEGLNDVERAQLELAVQEGRGAETWQRIQAERAEQETRAATRTFHVSDNGAKLVDEQPAPFVPEMDGYAETSGPPDDRPQPKKHVAIIPIQQGQLEGLLRSVPVLQKLDKRLLRLLSGLGSKARDVAGVDPKRGLYHAEPGETPNGIAKRLTGRSDRVNELFAANPGNTGPIWYIPPGWLAYEPDTGAITTARRYTVVQNDTPYKIAQKFGAFSTRSKWWTELKQANPDKPTKEGGANWKSLYAGEEIGLPEVWFLGNAPPSPVPVPPAPVPPSPVPVPPSPIPFPVPIPSSFPVPIPSSFPVPIPSFPMPPSGPGLPGPTQAGTQDPGVYLQAQALLALWARQNPSSCLPSDYGANPTDFTGTATPRTTMALASFQAWWNRSRSSSPLRADGVLDEATYRALYSVTAAQIPTSPPVPNPQPVPTPQPAPNPFPQFPQFPQFPPWFIPTTSTQNLPPWAVPSIPGLPSAPTPPAPTPEPSTPEPDDGPAIPLMAMLGAGLFLS